MTEPTNEANTHLIKTRLIALLQASRKSNESRKSLKKFDALKEDFLFGSMQGSFISTTLAAEPYKARKTEERGGSTQRYEYAVLEETRTMNDHTRSPSEEDSFLNNEAYLQCEKDAKKRKRNDCYGIIAENDDRAETLSTCSDWSWCNNFLDSPVSSPEISFLEEDIHRDRNFAKEDIKNSMTDYEWREQRSFIAERENFFVINQM